MLRTPHLVERIADYKSALWADIMKYDIESKQQLQDLGLSQSEVSEFFNGKLGRFSLERVLMIAILLGHEPKVQLL